RAATATRPPPAACTRAASTSPSATAASGSSATRSASRPGGSSTGRTTASRPRPTFNPRRPTGAAGPGPPAAGAGSSLPAPAAAPEGEGFTYPGTIPWAAKEGRLRLLQTDGKVYELTWGRELPDGGTLVDVMSPSVSLDGERILFAGRKAPPDPGRWRIYEV